MGGRECVCAIGGEWDCVGLHKVARGTKGKRGPPAAVDYIKVGAWGLTAERKSGRRGCRACARGDTGVAVRRGTARLIASPCQAPGARRWALFAGVPVVAPVGPVVPFPPA